MSIAPLDHYDKSEIDRLIFFEDLPCGIWPCFTEKTATKEGVITELKCYITEIQARKLIKRLPDEWLIKLKPWLSPPLVRNTIIDLMSDFEFINFYNDKINYTLEEILNKRNLTIEFNDDYDVQYSLLEEYLNNITIIILQYLNSKWTAKSDKSVKIEQDHLFPVPLKLKEYLPLFSGVSNKKFNDYQCKFDNNKGCFKFQIEYMNLVIDKQVQNNFNNGARFKGTYYLEIDNSALEEYGYSSNAEELIPLINKAFSFKGLYYLLTFFYSMGVGARVNEIDEFMSEYFKRIQPKAKQINNKVKEDLFDLLFIFSNCRISTFDLKKRIARPLFINSGDKSKKILKDIRKFRIKLKFYALGDFNSEENRILLPTNIIHENLVSNQLKFYLSSILTIFWKDNQLPKISIQDFLDSCSLESYANPYYGGVYNKRQLRHIEEDLNYLRDYNYIGEWIYLNKIESNKTKLVFKNKKFPLYIESDQENEFDYFFIKPSEFIKTKSWLNCYISFSPPAWSSIAKYFTWVNQKCAIKYKLQGKDLFGIRMSQNYSQLKFAKLLKISESYLSQMENGRRPITTNILNKLRKLGFIPN